MASGFNTNGSGLIKGKPLQGIPQNQGLGSAVKYIAANFGKKPQQGIIDQHKPTTPVKSITDNTGTTVNFHAPAKSSSSGSSTGSNPGMIPQSNQQPQAGTPQYYANKVEQASDLNNNPEYQMLNKQQNYLVGTQTYSPNIPFAGRDLSIPQQAANVMRPQSTGNLAGTLGTLNAATGSALAGNAAEAQRLISGAQLGTEGASTNLKSALPQIIAPGQKAYNPLQGQNIPGIGGNAFSGGQELGNVALGQQFSQTILPAYNQAGTIKSSFQNFLQQNPSINASNLNLVNAAQQWLSGKQLSDPNQAKLGQFLTEFTNTLSPIVGSSGDVTNFKQELVNGLINATASGQSLSQAIDSLYQIAGSKVQDIYNTGTGSGYTGGSSGSSTGGGNYNF